MAVHESTHPGSFRYADLETFPDDHMRREIIDGELIVTPSPSTRHQRAVVLLTARLFAYAESNGGEVFCAPLDVLFADDNVVEPDVLFVRSDHLDRLEVKFVHGVPDLVIEVSSPSTRHLELVRKRELYARFGVPEYWYVDLDADRIEVYLLGDGDFTAPTLTFPGQRLEATQLPGFSVSVQEVLGL